MRSLFELILFVVTVRMFIRLLVWMLSYSHVYDRRPYGYYRPRPRIHFFFAPNPMMWFYHRPPMGQMGPHFFSRPGTGSSFGGSSRGAGAGRF